MPKFAAIVEVSYVEEVVVEAVNIDEAEKKLWLSELTHPDMELKLRRDRVVDIVDKVVSVKEDEE